MISMMLWIEGGVALVIVCAFVIHAFVAFKSEHVEHHPARVRIGAAIQGLVIGLLIGFVLVPLRMQFMGGDAAPLAPSSALGYLPAFLMLIFIRRGALLRAPLIARYLRAYRRAGLLRARDEAIKALGKLDEIEGRGRGHE